jgi:fucose 4-O-acetylase-like acetyltransferase
VSWDDRLVRERSIDLYRAFAILTVVVGHWLAFALRVEDGRLTGQNLLGIWPPAPWLTWFFQVMPLFFVVGGYGNAASWSRQGPTTTSIAWIGARLWRLLLPSVVLLAVASVAAVGARVAGAGGTTLDLALAVVGLPLWFLAVYVVVVATTPWLVAAERRVGLRLPLALLGACLVVDVLANHLGVSIVGWSTYALFWLGVYSVGICWHSAALLRRAWLPAALAGTGACALVLLTTLGPYPVSMLAAPGERIQNNGPPSAALVALAVTQIGVALLLRHRVGRWCERRRLWAGVVAVNLSAMSIYLWHMVAALGAAVLFWRLGLVEAAQAPSAAWWAQRPLWYLVCAALLLAVVAVVRPVEARRPVQRPLPATRARGALLATGVLLAAAGMVQLTVSGLAGGPAGLPVAGLGATVVGMLAVRSAAGIEGSARLTLPSAVGDPADAPLRR